VFDGGVTRPPLLALTTVAVVLGLVAAPALSSRPYRPDPVDFSLAGGPIAGHPGPADGVVSEPLRAPKRFNLVGITWDRGGGAPAVAVRTRADGEDWTRWTPVDSHAEDGPDPGSAEASAAGATNPVWAGEADWVQYRSSRRLPGTELHFVNTAGTATAADRARTGLRHVANAAIVSVAGLLSTKLAGASEPRPAIVPREDWAGDDCVPRTSPSYGQVRAAYVHHTVNANDYTAAEAPQIVLAMCRYHRNTNGWNDLGYNFVVDRFGTIYEGRAGGIEAAVLGAQAEGFNSYSTGIANIGTFSDVPQSHAALEAMARLIRWKLPLHGYPTSGTAVMVSAGGATNRYPSGTSVRVPRILGHRDTNSTECPGSALYAQLGELRAMAGGVAPQGTATRVEARLTTGSTLDYGEEAILSGRLTTVGDAPVASQPVAVQTRVDGKWKTSSAPVTGADGTFAAPLRPKLTRPVRVRFAGAGELRSSIAPTLTLAVRPVVGLRRPPRRGVRGVTVRLTGRVKPRKLVYQVLQLGRRGSFRKVGAKALRTTRTGAFSGSFVPARAGTYRYYVSTRAAGTMARGASKKITLRVARASRSRAILR
jgi:N-acetylmuramoyl-L-alanine amidase